MKKSSLVGELSVRFNDNYEVANLSILQC